MRYPDARTPHPSAIRATIWASADVPSLIVVIHVATDGGGVDARGRVASAILRALRDG